MNVDITAPHRARMRVLWLALALLASLLGTAAVQGQEQATAASVPEDSDGIGPLIRRIFFYESQAPRLVPPSFWPVRIDELEAALARETQVPQPGEDQPQLVSAVYVARFADGALISDPDASRLDLAYRDDAPGVLSLGQINLALRPSPTAKPQAQVARLLTRADGTVQAVVNQDCRLRFGWSRRGSARPDGGHDFELRIPPCGRTRILLGLPREMELRATDGVVTALPNPPQEAQGTTNETSLAWYSVEAGGLPRVRLSVVPSSADPEAHEYTLRRMGMDCLVAPSGLDWTARMAVDLPQGRGLPPVEVIAGGRITAVRLDNTPVRWNESAGERGTRVEVQAAVSSAPPTHRTVTLEISGTSAGPTDQGSPLPWVTMAQGEPSVASAQTEVVLRTTEPLRVAEFAEDDSWRIESSAVDGGDGSRIYRMTGPPCTAPPRIRVEMARPTLHALAALRLAVYPDELLANWQAEIAIGRDNLRPLRFELQSGWQIESIAIHSSGRIVDLPAQAAGQSELTIWPEPQDIASGAMRIQIMGRREGGGSAQALPVESSWFVRLAEAVSQGYAAVVPPAEFEWDPATALRGRQVDADQLPSLAAEMIGPVSQDTLLFETDFGAIPSLNLSQPPAAFHSDLHLDLWVEGDMLVERLRVAFRVPAGKLSEVRVPLGDPLGRPPIRWSIEAGVGGEAAALESLEARRITDGSSPDEIWALAPAGGVRDGLVLVGQRRYPLSQWQQKTWTLPLPSVPNAASAQAISHRASVALGPRLRLEGTVGEVLRIPKPAPPLTSRTAEPEARGVDGPSSSPANGRLGTGVNGAVANSMGHPSQPSEAEMGSAQWLLRYDASDRAALRLAVVESPPLSLVVWDERVEMLAGIGGDEVRVEYQLEGRQPLEVVFEPGLRVTRVEGAQRVDQADETGRVVLRPDGTSGGVAVTLWRSREGRSRWLHALRPPRIEASATVLRKHWRVWGGADLVLVAAAEHVPPPSWMSAEATALSMPMDAGARLWVVPASMAWAFGGALAVVVFAASWWLVDRRPWLVLGGLLAAGVCVVVMPVWAGAILGFVMVPCAAAGLLASALDRSGPDSGSRSARTLTDGGSTAAHEGRSSRRSSALVTGLPLLVASFLWTCGGTQAAQNEPDGDGGESIPVMIPIRQDGQLAGERAYVPRTLYETLFRPGASQDELGVVDFESAEYQVRILPSGTAGAVDTVAIEATWRVEIESTARQIRLPIDPAALDRLEVLVDSVPNEIRTQPDGASVLVRPPRTGVNVLRATLSPDVRASASGAGRIQMTIPPVAQSLLTVTSDAPLKQVLLPVCLGQVTQNEPGSRLSASLGPVASLEVLWQRGGVASGRSNGPLHRRWWIHAGNERLTRELELDVGDGLPMGVVVEVAGEMLQAPRVTTPQWTMVAPDPLEAPRDRWMMRAAVDAPGPIRLMWSEPVQDLASLQMVVPDVRPIDHQGPIETLVGVDLPDGWEIIEWSAARREPGSGSPPAARTTANEEAEPVATPLDPSDFATEWRGYRSGVQFARSITGPGRIVMRATETESRPPLAEEHHRVTVHETHLRVDYRALLHGGALPLHPLVVRVPETLRIERLTFDGQPLRASVGRASAGAGVQELILPPLTTAGSSVLGIQGVIPLGEDRRFAPPRMHLDGIQVLSSRYELDRVDGLQVHERTAPADVIPWAGGGEYDLTAGTVPLTSWELPADPASEAPSLSGEYAVHPVFERFSARSLTALRWDDGLWTMEVTVDAEDLAGMSDFLTFEIPSRWIEGLDVRPAVKWSVQPSTDPNTHLIRVLPPTTSAARLAPAGESSSAHQLRLRITSTLESTGEGGVAVPDVQLLGAGTRQRFLAMPRRLTSNPISWQMQSTRSAELPARFADVAPSGSTHTFHEVLGESFTASLRPAEMGDDTARVSAMEVALFPRDARTRLALIRWMLLPGDRQSVQVRVPRGGQILGAWASGIAVGAWADDSQSHVTIPVGLSRLAQQMAILVVLPCDDEQGSVPLPRPIDLPVEETWVICYDAPASRWNNLGGGHLSAPWQRSTPEGHHAGLATAVMDILNGSVDNVAERPAAEKRDWLRPWIARLRRLGWDPADVQTTENALAQPSATASARGGTVSADNAVDVEASPEEWDQWNRWMPRFLQRVFGSDASLEALVATDHSTAWLIAPPSWPPAQVARIPGVPHQVPAELVPGENASRANSRWGLFALLIGGATWVLASGTLYAVRWRWAIQPAVWLLLLGLLSLAFAPLPVSIAGILLALTGPWLRRGSLAA